MKRGDPKGQSTWEPLTLLLHLGSGLHSSLLTTEGLLFIRIQPFSSHSPNPRRDESCGCDGHQHGVLDIVLFNPPVPFQIDYAVKGDGQADKQQGPAEEKPAVETKKNRVLPALGEAAETSVASVFGSEVMSSASKSTLC